MLDRITGMVKEVIPCYLIRECSPAGNWIHHYEELGGDRELEAGSIRGKGER